MELRGAGNCGYTFGMNFVVLSSSRGTTFQAVIDAMENGSLQARCLGLIADREDRGCVSKARAAGLPVKILERLVFAQPSSKGLRPAGKAMAGKQKGQERQEYDRRVDEAIAALMRKADERRQMAENPILACIGWMFLFSPWFVSQWKNRILNVHPSLLPKYPGAHAVDDALHTGDSETGMTIHWIDEDLDTGKILVQKKCSIEKGDTVDTLKARIQTLEKEWYPKVLQDLETGKLRMEN